MSQQWKIIEAQNGRLPCCRMFLSSGRTPKCWPLHRCRFVYDMVIFTCSFFHFFSMHVYVCECPIDRVRLLALVMPLLLLLLLLSVHDGRWCKFLANWQQISRWAGSFCSCGSWEATNGGTAQLSGTGAVKELWFDEASFCRFFAWWTLICVDDLGMMYLFRFRFRFVWNWVTDLVARETVFDYLAASWMMLWLF